MKNKYIITSLIIIGIILFACSSSDSSNNSIDYKKEISNTVVDKLILPRLEIILNKATDLKTAINNFSNTKDQATLLNARTKLIEFSDVYAKMYVFNIGEAKNRFYNRRINFWPVYNISIENSIASGDFDASTISESGSAAKNLPGLNYLLFKNFNLQDQLTEFQNETNRIEFLVLLSNEFHSIITDLYNLWNPNGENYANTFKNISEEGLFSSFNLLYNGLYNVASSCKVTKVGKPGGLENSNFTNPEIVENFYTQNSLDLIYNNIVSIEEVFFNQEIVSMSDYIKHITKNDDLNTLLQEKFSVIKNSISAISLPLKTAVDNEPEKVQQLHTDLNALLVLLHNDVRSTLSIIITGTDNDGD